MIAECGESCPVLNWNEKDRKIIPGTAVRRKDLGVGGFSLNADFKCHILVSELVDATMTTSKAVCDAMGQTEFQYLDDDYKVQSVSRTAGDLFLIIEANSLNQGA